MINIQNSLLIKIQELELISKRLEPKIELRKDWTDKVNQFAFEFIDSLNEQSAFQMFGSLKDCLNLNLEENSTQEISTVLSDLKENLISQGLNPASGGHLGYIPGGGIYGTALGDYLAAITNQYAGIFYGGPGAVKIENELIRWMASLFGYPENSHGNLSSGGSIANLIAIVTAREARQIKSSEISIQCIYLTEQVHHCVHKAIRISGLGEAQIRFIGMDSKFRMDGALLRNAIIKDKMDGFTPFLVVGSAGTTDTGAIDPLDLIAEIAQEAHIWFHVDAAYGGFFTLCNLKNEEGRTYKDLLKGIERSDSLVVDPHKGLFLSYGLGAVLIKDTAAQYRAHYYKAAYMQDTLSNQEELSPSDLSPELTKHFRGLRLWLPLKLHGLAPFRACLEEKILLCRYFYDEIGKLGFERGPFPETSVCIYRYVPESSNANEFNQKLVDYIVQNGRVFVSSTSINGVFWIRIAILSFRTHLTIIQDYLDLLKQALTKLKD
ncbi:MAG: amino acid decarboxylase [Saprospiraceae bacterium]|nr:amino acid decarboxylase [Saprospiraceae bacterium]